jgi:colanic acid biosynthesis glycosyl transferase WcaI
MSKNRFERWLLVFEFPPGKHEWQLRDLGEALGRSSVTSRTVDYCAGFLTRYRPGGLSPLRLVNGLWVHLRAVVSILFGRWTHIVVRSSPPLIQMAVGVACRLRGIPYGIWLMDAHPELEAEIWRDWPLMGAPSGALARRNARCLERAEFVVVLDEAMRQRLVPHLPASRVVICPTWGDKRPALKHAAPPAPPQKTGLRLVYLGNMGMAHDVPGIVRLLRAAAKCGPVSVAFWGSGQKIVNRIARELTDCAVEFSVHPAVPFERLADELAPAGFHYGLVALQRRFAGLLSPSKYIGYLAAGLPVICWGPPGNNSAYVCDRLHAGARIDPKASDAELTSAIDMILDEQRWLAWRANTAQAAQFFYQFGGEFLAAQIDSMLDSRCN